MSWSLCGVEFKESLCELTQNSCKLLLALAKRYSFQSYQHSFFFFFNQKVWFFWLVKLVKQGWMRIQQRVAHLTEIFSRWNWWHIRELLKPWLHCVFFSSWRYLDVTACAMGTRGSSAVRKGFSAAMFWNISTYFLLSPADDNSKSVLQILNILP